MGTAMNMMTNQSPPGGGSRELTTESKLQVHSLLSESVAVAHR